MADFIPDSEFQPDVATPTQPQTQPSQDFIPDSAFQPDETKHAGMLEGAKAAYEGATQGLMGPVAPFIEKHILDVPAENIRGRAEAHPIAHGLGEAAGLIGGMTTGTGEAALMEHAGQAAVKAAGLAEPVSLAAKIGSSAVKQAAEMAVLQGSDEIAKQIVQDPDASAQTAMANIGMASLIGAGGGAFMTGAVSPLWKATVGPRAEAGLKALSDRLGGIEGQGTNLAKDLGMRAGIEVPEALEAKLNGNEQASRAFSKLNQTDTTIAGRKLQQEANSFRDELGSKLAETVGHTPNSVESLSELNKYDTGRSAGEVLAKDLDREVKGNSANFEKINDTFRGSDFTLQNQAQTSEELAKLSLDQGLHKAQDESGHKLLMDIQEKLGKQDTAEDLKKFVTNLRDAHPYGSPTYNVARDAAKILRSAQKRAVIDGITAVGGTPEQISGSLKAYADANANHAQLMDKLDALNEHLHVGKYSSPQGFVNNLKEMAISNGEGVLNRLSGANKAQVLQALNQVSPEAVDIIKKHQIDQLIRASKIGDTLNVSKFTKNFDKLSPQVKDMVASPEAQARINAIGELHTRLHDDTHNWSNTARTMDKITHGAASPLALLAALFGHGGEAVLAHIGKIGFNEGRDALRYSMLKFLSSGQPIKAEGFKAMTQYMANAIKGAALLAKASEAVFKPGSQVLASNLMPDSKDREKLSNIVDKYEKSPNELVDNMKGDAGHYMPDHQQSLASSTVRNLEYLKGIKPQPVQLSPLDEPIKPSPEATARYNRALDIANQPAVVLQHVKDGTVQVSDLQDLKALYPALYPKISQQLSNAMINRSAEDNQIPYKTRMGISLFLGQPIDSTMTPQSIMAAQPKPKPQNQNQQSPEKKQKHSTSSLNKVSKSYQTPGQGAEADRSSRD